jgi:hypothetical protein
MGSDNVHPDLAAQQGRSQLKQRLTNSFYTENGVVLQVSSSRLTGSPCRTENPPLPEARHRSVPFATRMVSPYLFSPPEYRSAVEDILMHAGCLQQVLA